VHWFNSAVYHPKDKAGKCSPRFQAACSFCQGKAGSAEGLQALRIKTLPPLRWRGQGLRKKKEKMKMNTTPLDGYKKIIVTILTTVLSVVLFFVKDPVQAQTLSDLFTSLIIPLAPIIAGIVYNIVQGSVDKAIILSLPNAQSGLTAGSGLNSNVIARNEVTKQSPEAAALPSSAQAIPSAPIAPVTTGAYNPADLDGITARCAEELKAEKVEVNWQTIAGKFLSLSRRFDLALVPPANRLEESKRWIAKAVDLCRSAFTEFVGFDAPRSLAEIGNYYDYLSTIRNHFTSLYGCNKRVVDENIRYQVRQLIYVYEKQVALAGLEGKQLDWTQVEKQYLTPWGITEQGL
jgi:hypothetical protein